VDILRPSRALCAGRVAVTQTPGEDSGMTCGYDELLL
jgi:hypothetical protein